MDQEQRLMSSLDFGIKKRGASSNNRGLKTGGEAFPPQHCDTTARTVCSSACGADEDYFSFSEFYGVKIVKQIRGALESASGAYPNPREHNVQ